MGLSLLQNSIAQLCWVVGLKKMGSWGVGSAECMGGGGGDCGILFAAWRASMS